MILFCFVLFCFVSFIQVPVNWKWIEHVCEWKRACINVCLQSRKTVLIESYLRPPSISLECIPQIRIISIKRHEEMLMSFYILLQIHRQKTFTTHRRIALICNRLWLIQLKMMMVWDHCRRNGKKPTQKMVKHISSSKFLWFYYERLLFKAFHWPIAFPEYFVKISRREKQNGKKPREKAKVCSQGRLTCGGYFIFYPRCSFSQLYSQVLLVRFCSWIFTDDFYSRISFTLISFCSWILVVNYYSRVLKKNIGE